MLLLHLAAGGAACRPVSTSVARGRGTTPHARPEACDARERMAVERSECRSRGSSGNRHNRYRATAFAPVIAQRSSGSWRRPLSVRRPTCGGPGAGFVDRGEATKALTSWQVETASIDGQRRQPHTRPGRWRLGSIACSRRLFVTPSIDMLDHGLGQPGGGGKGRRGAIRRAHRKQLAKLALGGAAILVLGFSVAGAFFTFLKRSLAAL
jgi:hypothetical protein